MLSKALRAQSGFIRVADHRIHKEFTHELGGHPNTPKEPRRPSGCSSCLAPHKLR